MRRHRARTMLYPFVAALALTTLSSCYYVGSVGTSTSTTTTTTVPAGTTLLADQFNGTALDTTSWIALNRPGDASNNELECYKPANVTEGGGNLTIHTLADTSCSGYAYTSGMIQTRSFNFTYGTVEFRARFAGGTGTWPAVWLLGANCQQSNITSADNVAPCNWPQTGSDEIDIAEIKNAQLTTVSEGYFANGGNFGTCTPTVTDVSTNWHTYTLIWAPGELTWKIDGITTCDRTSNIPSTPMFPIINTAVGGTGGGTVDPATLPQQTDIDYLTITK